MYFFHRVDYRYGCYASGERIFDCPESYGGGERCRRDTHKVTRLLWVCEVWCEEEDDSGKGFRLEMVGLVLALLDSLVGARIDGPGFV
jgi:hypothetical protein